VEIARHRQAVASPAWPTTCPSGRTTRSPTLQMLWAGRSAASSWASGQCP